MVAPRRTQSSSPSIGSHSPTTVSRMASERRSTPGMFSFDRIMMLVMGLCCIVLLNTKSGEGGYDVGSSTSNTDDDQYGSTTASSAARSGGSSWGFGAASSESDKVVSVFELNITSDDLDGTNADPMAPNKSLIDVNYVPQHVKAPLWKNKHKLVHILTTRFCQMQGNLVALGQARFELFNTFTVPSVLAQSTDEFLWLVFTDPNLHPTLLTQMMAALKPFKGNVVLIGSNHIFKDFINDPWVEKIDKMFLGDLAKIQDYQAAAKSHVLVQTRLDADDSIFRDMMKNVQQQAARTLGAQAEEHRYNPLSFNIKQYRVFCTEHHVEWGYFNPWDPKSDKGHLFGVSQPEFCVTAGLTYAYQVGTTSADMPTRAHNKMSKLIKQCDNVKYKHNCIERIDAGDYKWIMIRSRTPTSTAMQGVIPTQKVKKSMEWQNLQETTWATVIEQNFNVSPQSVWKLRMVFKQNMQHILKDALKGQCAKREFTCKDSAIQALEKLMEEVKKHS